MKCFDGSIMRTFWTRRRDLQEVVTCFCGPTHLRKLPDDLLRLILLLSGLVKIGKRGIRFNIFFPPIDYKQCLSTVRRKGRKGRENSRAGTLL